MRTTRIKTGYGTLQRDVMKSGLTQGAKLVYALFITYAGDAGECFPSIPTICKDLKMSKKTVGSSIKELLEWDLLEVETRHTKTGAQTSNKYYPMMLSEGDELRGGNEQTPPAGNEQNPGEGLFSPGGEATDSTPNINTLNNNNENLSLNSEELKGAEFTEFEMMEPKSDEPNTPPVATTPLKSTHAQMMDIYYEWFKGRNGGVKPNINAAEGKAMKDIVRYFEGVAVTKLHESGETWLPTDVPEKACKMLKWVFSKWNELEPFLQKQVKLSQISSNLTNIINYLKNGRDTQTPQQQKADRVGTINAGFAAIDEYFANQKQS